MFHFHKDTLHMTYRHIVVIQVFFFFLIYFLLLQATLTEENVKFNGKLLLTHREG